MIDDSQAIYLMKIGGRLLSGEQPVFNADVKNISPILEFSTHTSINVKNTQR